MTAFVDRSGQRFGRLTALERRPPKNGSVSWLCKCDCGKEVVVDSSNLKQGITRSCGCLRVDAHAKHGHASRSGQSPTWRTWAEMKARCGNKKAPYYARYGGRGIRVCERWMTYASFLADMGERPSIKHSIDRLDVNGNYEPGNCRWANSTEQSRNKRNTVYVLFKGEKITLAALAERYAISLPMVRDRLRCGWDIERALTEPRCTLRLRRAPLR